MDQIIGYAVERRLLACLIPFSFMSGWRELDIGATRSIALLLAFFGSHGC